MKMYGAGRRWIALVEGKGKLRMNETVERNESIAHGKPIHNAPARVGWISFLFMKIGVSIRDSFTS